MGKKSIFSISEKGNIFNLIAQELRLDVKMILNRSDIWNRYFNEKRLGLKK